MKLYDILDFGLMQEIDQICGSNAATFPFKTKTARINSALSRYVSIAFKSNSWPFDDINQSSPPIDTQDIVSGTNRYKFSSFTEKILSLIKLEILNSDGIGIELIPENFNSFDSNLFYYGDSSRTFQELYLNTSYTGVPTHYCKYGDFIYLRPFPNYSETDGLKVYFNRPASKFNFTRFTVSIATPGLFTTSAAHGLVANDQVMFETDGALPTGLSVDTVYYVISAGLTTDDFEVSLTQGGTAINTSVSQSGNHSFLKISGEPGINPDHHIYLARKASIPFLMEKKLPQLNSILKLVGSDNPRDPYYGGDELDISTFFSSRDKDKRDIFKSRITPFR
jgi:hypothetical protein